MTTLIDALGHEIEVEHNGAPTARVGELWLTSWDGRPVALIVVAAVRDGYALGWPVTAATGHDTYPCVPLPDDGAGQNLTAWPDAEFGLSLALLDSRVSAPFDAKTVRLIVGAVRGDTDMPVPAEPDRPSPEADADLDAVAGQAWAVGDVDWPLATPGHGVLNTDVLAQAGVDARGLAESLRVPAVRASQLAAGHAVPTSDELARIGDSVADVDDLLVAPSGDEVDAIMHPRFKARIVAVANAEGVTEADARTRLYVIAEPMAARHTPGTTASEAATARVDAALDQMLNPPAP